MNIFLKRIIFIVIILTITDTKVIIQSQGANIKYIDTHENYPEINLNFDMEEYVGIYQNTRYETIKALEKEFELMKNDINVNNEWISLGDFKISHYCPGACCNGIWAGKTKTGNEIVPYHTIAVDKNIIPLGSIIMINGNEYLADDIGGGINGKHIDKAVACHESALQYGIKYEEVFIMRNNNKVATQES